MQVYKYFDAAKKRSRIGWISLLLGAVVLARELPLMTSALRGVGFGLEEDVDGVREVARTHFSSEGNLLLGGFVRRETIVYVVLHLPSAYQSSSPSRMWAVGLVLTDYRPYVFLHSCH